MKNETIHRIKLTRVRSMIPNLLYNKLENLGIDDVQGVLELKITEFKMGRGIGPKAISQLRQFQALITNKPEELLEKYEDEISNVIKISEDSELGKIPLEGISELIDNKLINKFHLNGVDNIYQLSKISEYEFSLWKSVGKTSRTLFRELILKLKEEPRIFITAYNNKTIPKQLPFEDSVQELKIDTLEEFKRIVNDYLSLLINTKERERDILIKRYGLFNNDQYNTVEIGLYYELTHERIRQLVLKHLKNLKFLLDGGILQKPFCILDSETKDRLDNINDFLKDLSLLSFENLVKLFQERFQISSISQNERYLSILFDVLGIETSAETSIPFSNTEYYFIDSKVNKSLFYETCKYCFDFLRDIVTPIKEFDLIISLRKQYRKVSKEYIQLVLSQMPEIEIIKDTEGGKLYQIRFDRLKSVGDQAERVLYERGRSMNLDEIVSEINHRLFNLGESKTITRKSLAALIRQNKNIIPKGKTGYNSLADWEDNSETIYDVIYKSFLFHQSPLNHQEIIKYVKAIRPNLKASSIRTITNDRFTPIKGKRYIIPSWEHRYQEDILPKNKRKKRNGLTIKEQMRRMLLEEPQRKLEQRAFSKKAREKLGIGFPTFYASINDKNLFIKTEVEGVRFVTAIENPIIAKNDKKKEALNLIYQLLARNNGSVLLADLVKAVEKMDIPRASTYKFIASDYNLEKSRNNEGKVIVIMKRNITQPAPLNQDWNLIKKKIEREIKDIFDDSRQPQYLVSFSDALDMFYKLIVKPTSESGLNGLEERLLPTLKKYFDSNDRNDRLNFLTQIVLFP